MAWSENLGRTRTKLGSWMDRNKITQGDLHSWSGISRPTITKLCGDVEYRASQLTKRTVIAALINHGYDADERDFW